MVMKRLIAKAGACFAGVAIGDALGMPVEMMTREQILAATGGRGIRGLRTPIQRIIPDTRGLPAGSVTDDTRLTVAVARSLIDCGGFDLVDQAKWLVQAYRLSQMGFGRTTRKAAEALGRELDQPGAGRDPQTPAPPPKKPGAACGNGVAMKIAPLAAFCAARYGRETAGGDRNLEPLLTWTMQLGLQTHGDPRASFAAAALAVLIQELLLQPQAMSGDDLIARAADLVTFTADVLESRYQHYRQQDDKATVQFEKLFWHLDSPDSLREEVGTGCFALESVPFAIGTFLRHPTDFRAALLEAVNAGGDTDSTASMVGALVGANVGPDALPPKWRDGVEYVDLMRALGAQVVLSGRHAPDDCPTE